MSITSRELASGTRRSTTFSARRGVVVGRDPVVAALHRREPRALAGHVVEHEVREAAQELRVVGAERLLDRLRVLGPLEDADDVGALAAAAERLRIVEVEQADDEVRVLRVAVRGRRSRRPRAPSRSGARSGRALPMWACRRTRTSCGYEPNRDAPARSRARARSASARSSSSRRRRAAAGASAAVRPGSAARGRGRARSRGRTRLRRAPRRARP